MRGPKSGLGPLIAAANGNDPSDDQQYWKYQAPHEPAVHQASLSVVSEHAVALGRLLVTISLRRNYTRDVTRLGRGAG